MFYVRVEWRYGFIKKRVHKFCFLKFREWMESVDGEEKKSKGLTQNISQARTFLIRVEYQAVESLLSRENVRSKWFTPFKKKLLPGVKHPRRPGTMSSYCDSLWLFIDFLISLKMMKNPNSIKSMGKICK